jgi:photosystem II stability/assembly factor-like uncharacterized protein
LVAWRARTGECGGAPVLQRTADAGATWTDYTVDLIDVGALLQLEAVSEVRVRALAGTGDNCVPLPIESYTMGVFWERPSTPTALWQSSAGGGGAVSGPTGEVPTPCRAVAALASRSAGEAAVVCTDGSLQVTEDGGGTWAAPLTDRSAAAVAGTDSGYTVAVLDDDRCDGLGLVAVRLAAASTTRDGSFLSCLDSSTTSPVVMSAARAAVWVWVGEEVLVSRDGGRSWGDPSD